MTNNEKIEQEISQHLNRADNYLRKRVEQNREYQAALQKGEMETARGIVCGILYGTAETKKEQRKVLRENRQRDDLLDI